MRAPVFVDIRGHQRPYDGHKRYGVRHHTGHLFENDGTPGGTLLLAARPLNRRALSADRTRLAVNIAALQHNVGDYGERATIVVKQAAAWSEACALSLSESTCHVPGNTSTCTAFFTAESPPAEQVPAVALDDLIDEAAALGAGRVSLLKIDAEGAEYPALLTATRLELVDAIVGETHVNVTWDGVARDHEEVFAALRSRGFRVESQVNGPCTRIFWARR